MKPKHLIIIFLILEIVLRFFPTQFQVRTFEANSNLGIIKNKSKFYSDRFCDTVHQNKLGEETLAIYIDRKLKDFFGEDLDSLKVWSFGASTTMGNNCNSNTSWPQELTRLNRYIEVKNFAQGGLNSSESLRILEKNIANVENKKILWAHGFSEIAFYGNKKDYSWEKIQKPRKYEQKSLITFSNIITFIFRLDLTVSKYIFTYRTFRILIDRFVIRFINGNTQFIASILGAFRSQTETKEISEGREQYVFTGGFLGGPVRNLFSDDSQSVALSLYIENLKQLKKLSILHNFEVTCLSLPYIEGGFSHYSKTFGSSVDKWIGSIEKATVDTCQALEFNVIDLKMDYKNLALKDSRRSE